MTNFLKHILIIFLITGCQSLNNIGNNIGSTIGFLEEDPFAPTKIQTDYKNFLKSNWVKRNTNSFKFSELGKKRPAKNLFFASSGDRLFSIFDNLEVIDITTGETLKEVSINENSIQTHSIEIKDISNQPLIIEIESSNDFFKEDNFFYLADLV